MGFGLNNLLFLATVCITSSSQLELSKGIIGPKVFTFVHGGVDAKMNFTNADAFCRTNVTGPLRGIESAGVITNEQEAIGGGETTLLSNASDTDTLVLRTRLASLHSFAETTNVVKWSSKKEKRTFWIGGIVTKTLNEYDRPIFVLHWTDGSNSEYSLLKLPNPELSTMSVGDKRCVSVDYATGQWGVHHCSDKQYFLCLTIPVVGRSDEKLLIGSDTGTKIKPAKQKIVSAEEFYHIFG